MQLGRVKSVSEVTQTAENESKGAAEKQHQTIALEGPSQLEAEKSIHDCLQAKRQTLLHMVRQPYDELGFLGVLKQIFYPVKSFETLYDDKTGDGATQITLCPEAFRMCFYVYFIFFMMVGIFVSSTWAETDLEDNPILNRFGANNLCIYLDDPPFSVFGATLWFPAEVMVLSYELLDWVRLYDHYIDAGCDEIHRGFFIYYTCSTVFESMCCIVFPQVFATSPTENIYMHSWPYFLLLYALWFILLKRLLYLWRVGAFEHWSSVVWWMSCVYAGLSLITVLIKVSTGIPNLHGARLFETEAWNWLGPVVSFNSKLYLFLNMVCPLIIYGIIGKELDVVVVTLNRKLPSTSTTQLASLVSTSSVAPTKSATN